MTISRRSFLKVGGLGVLGIGATSYPSPENVNTAHAVTEHISVPISRLPSAFRDYRIGFISDFHLGSFVPHEWVIRALKVLEEQRVDVIVFGGDYIGYRDSFNPMDTVEVRNPRFTQVTSDELALHLFTELSGLLTLAHAPDGVFGVFGNHDRYLSMPKKKRLFYENGVTPLVNENREIRRGDAVLNIIGVDDLQYGTPLLPRLPILKSEKCIRLLLAHNPDYFSQLLRHSSFQFDLGLAGHTHGGQIKLPLLGAVTYATQHRDFCEGLNFKNGSYVYTTRGIGVVKVPIRLNCPPEITVLQLVEA